MAEFYTVQFPKDEDDDGWEAFQKVMDEIQDGQTTYVKSQALILGVNELAAADIVYLRTRSRWTQEKEDYLIKLAKEGKELPNIFEDFEPR